MLTGVLGGKDKAPAAVGGLPAPWRVVGLPPDQAGGGHCLGLGGHARRRPLESLLLALLEDIVEHSEGTGQNDQHNRSDLRIAKPPALREPHLVAKDQRSNARDDDQNLVGRCCERGVGGVHENEQGAEGVEAIDSAGDETDLEVKVSHRPVDVADRLGSTLTKEMGSHVGHDEHEDEKEIRTQLIEERKHLVVLGLLFVGELALGRELLHDRLELPNRPDPVGVANEATDDDHTHGDPGLEELEAVRGRPEDRRRKTSEREQGGHLEEEARLDPHGEVDQHTSEDRRPLERNHGDWRGQVGHGVEHGASRDDRCQGSGRWPHDLEEPQPGDVLAVPPDQRPTTKDHHKDEERGRAHRVPSEVPPLRNSHLVHVVLPEHGIEKARNQKQECQYSRGKHGCFSLPRWPKPLLFVTWVVCGSTLL